MTKHRLLIAQFPKSAMLLSLLVENMNDSNAVVISQKTLSEMAGCKIRALRNYIKVLEKQGWINILKIGTSNVYHVNRGYFWQQAPNQRYYAKIQANVLLSAEEQSQSIESLQEGREVTQLPRANESNRLVILDDEDPPTQEEMGI